MRRPRRSTLFPYTTLFRSRLVPGYGRPRRRDEARFGHEFVAHGDAAFVQQLASDRRVFRVVHDFPDPPDEFFALLLQRRLGRGFFGGDFRRRAVHGGGRRGRRRRRFFLGGGALDPVGPDRKRRASGFVFSFDGEVVDPERARVDRRTVADRSGAARDRVTGGRRAGVGGLHFLPRCIGGAVGRRGDADAEPRPEDVGRAGRADEDRGARDGHRVAETEDP